MVNLSPPPGNKDFFQYWHPPAFLISLPSTPKGPPEACRVEKTSYCSTYQDPLTPLPGVCGIIALVQGEAHVAWILQLPIGELDCKIVAQE